MKQCKNPASVFAVRVAITAALSCTVVATMSATLRAQEVRPEVDRNVIYGMVSGAALLMDVYHPAVPNGIGIVWIWGSGWDAPSPYGIWHLKGRAPDPAGRRVHGVRPAPRYTMRSIWRPAGSGIHPDGRRILFRGGEVREEFRVLENLPGFGR